MFPLIGIGILVVGTLAFWSAIQNWLADLIARFQNDLKLESSGLFSGLVVLDRVVVTGQRVIVATARAVFRTSENEYVTREEKKAIAIEDLPADVRQKLENGQTVSYELSANAANVPGVAHVPTYKLAVRRTN
jgi:sugar-specific transcriptional regulator TrmB